MDRDGGWLPRLRRSLMTSPVHGRVETVSKKRGFLEELPAGCMHSSRGRATT